MSPSKRTRFLWIVVMTVLCNFRSLECVAIKGDQFCLLFLMYLFSHTKSRNFLFDMVCNGVTVLVSRIWSKANPYPYVFRTLCNSFSASAQKKWHKWEKGSQRKSSVSGLYRRKCLHFSSLLILFGDLCGTNLCIDIRIYCEMGDFRCAQKAAISEHILAACSHSL